MSEDLEEQKNYDKLSEFDKITLQQKKYFEESNIKDGGTIESILGQDEVILKELKPNKKSYVLSKICSGFIIALFFVIFDAVFLTLFAFFAPIQELPKTMMIGIIVFLVIFFLIHLTPFWLFLGKAITSFKAFKNESYAITNQRIIITHGVVTFKYTSLYYSDISGVDIRIGIIDKLFKVGDILITTPVGNRVTNKNGNVVNAPYVLNDIDQPQLIASALQRIIFDNKQDMNFPNVIREKAEKEFVEDNKNNLTNEK